MGIAEYLAEHTITDKHKKVIQDIETYLSEGSERNNMHADFDGYKGGIDRLSHDLYQRASDHFESTQKKLGSLESDEEKKKHLTKQADKLVDELILETVRGMKGNEDAQTAIRNHEKRLEHGIYDGSKDEYHGQFLGQISEDYLGIKQEEMRSISNAAVAALTKNDAVAYQESVAQIREKLKGNLLRHRQGQVSQKLADSETRLSVNVHYLKEAEKKGFLPEKASVAYEGNPFEIRQFAKGISQLEKMAQTDVTGEMKKLGFKKKPEKK